MKKIEESEENNIVVKVGEYCRLKASNEIKTIGEIPSENQHIVLSALNEKEVEYSWVKDNKPNKILKWEKISSQNIKIDSNLTPFMESIQKFMLENFGYKINRKIIDNNLAYITRTHLFSNEFENKQVEKCAIELKNEIQFRLCKKCKYGFFRENPYYGTSRMYCLRNYDESKLICKKKIDGYTIMERTENRRVNYNGKERFDWNLYKNNQLIETSKEPIKLEQIEKILMQKEVQQ